MIKYFPTTNACAYLNALPESELVAIKTLTPPDIAKTDKYGSEIYMLYAAGILNGTDKIGTFVGDGSFTRAEAAAIVTRIPRRGSGHRHENVLT